MLPLGSPAIYSDTTVFSSDLSDLPSDSSISVRRTEIPPGVVELGVMGDLFFVLGVICCDYWCVFPMPCVITFLRFRLGFNAWFRGGFEVLPMVGIRRLVEILGVVRGRRVLRPMPPISTCLRQVTTDLCTSNSKRSSPSRSILVLLSIGIASVRN